MTKVRGLFVIAGLAALSLTGGCLVGSVIPDEEDVGVPTVEITDPFHGEQVFPQSSERFQAKITGHVREPATLRLTLGDSLMESWSPAPPDEIALYFVPGQWTASNTDLVVKLELEIATGAVFADSIVVSVGDYYTAVPALAAPLDRHVYFRAGEDGLELQAMDYDAATYGEDYEFEVAADSLFTVDVARETTGRFLDLPLPAQGEWYWRVRVTGDYGLASPWSETRSFHVVDTVAFSPDFLSLSRITRAVVGQHGTYLLGRDGGRPAVMKCDADLNKIWQATYADADNADAVHCDETPDGGLYVAADHAGSSYSYPSWLFLLSSEGAMLWDTELHEYADPTHVFVTSDDHLLCGFSGSYAPFLAKIDTTETADWELEPDNGSHCLRLLGDRDAGRYTYMSRTYTGAYRAGEVDLDGETLWSAGLNFAGTSANPEYALIRLADGDLVWGLSLNLSGSQHILLGKIGPTGDPVWQTHLDPIDDDDSRLYLGALHEHTDGDLFVVGYGRGSGYSDSRDVILARLAPDGAPRWLRTYGSNGLDEYGTDLIAGDDRLFLLGRQSGSGGEVALVLPVDFDGDLILDAFAEGGAR